MSIDQHSTNQYLAGNYAPIPAEMTATDLAVTGRIPQELDGRYLRNGPNPVTPPDPLTYHWFTGTGMLHGIRLRDGAAQWYRSRYVIGDEAAEILNRPKIPGPRHPLFGGASPNTNIVGIGNTVLASMEAGAYPVEIDDEMESVCLYDFGGTWAGSFTAHPHVDPNTGEVFVAAYTPEFANHVSYQVFGPDLRLRHEVRIEVGGMIMLHDLALSASRTLLFDLPVTFSMEAFAEGFKLPYRWDPAYRSRVGVLPRYGSADDVVWVDVDPCYVFHPMNARDLPDGRISVELVQHPKMFATDYRGPNDGTPTLQRWTIDPVGRTWTSEVLDDRGQEFPRINDSLLGRPNRYGYTASFGLATGDLGALTKWDLDAGTSQRREFGPGRSVGEGVFVPRQGATGEDDGWVMALVFDQAEDRSQLVILSAADFTGDPVATIHLPTRVPFGFHGNWIPSV